ncbi:MAG: glycosyl hydrolase [Gammaproteobacteria bacterium]|nr:glycosyl hydrolase [Gammaproteobacteria bacterium]
MKSMNRRDFLAASSTTIALTASGTAAGTPVSAAGSVHGGTVVPAAPIDVAGRSVAVYTTAAGTNHRLAATGTLRFQRIDRLLESNVCVFVDPARRLQTVLGVGGAITDASAETYARLPVARQRELIRAYYDANDGIGYTLARTNIHSCDFSSASYTYVREGDGELRSFSIDHDLRFRIPMIKQAMTAAGGKLTLFGSPWSPPAFMKDTGDMLHGGKLRPEFRQPWAGYFAKFIKAYASAGVPVWGVSVQNEPMAKQRWESCIYTAEDERDFVKDFLGPTLQEEGLGDTKIIVWDHNRDLVYQRASTILHDADAAKYVWGVGFHWYETFAGGEAMYDNVRLVREAFPDKHLIFTEGCADSFKADRLDDWKLGELYGRSMINDFNCGTVGWTDWNILLDETGGPNHVGNFCFAPVHADTRTGELTYTNSYYYIGHVSKFVRPGARRIVASPTRSTLLATAFVNPDGKVAVVVMNGGDAAVTYQLCIDGYAAEVTSPAHSMQTLVC